MSPVNADREVARIYARQAKRAAGAAVVALVGGTVATLALAFGLAPGNSAARWGILALGAALTAAVYAVMGHLQARAEAGAVRHLAASHDVAVDVPLDASLDE
jgi:hypothetical protein